MIKTTRPNKKSTYLWIPSTNRPFWLCLRNHFLRWITFSCHEGKDKIVTFTWNKHRFQIVLLTSEILESWGQLGFNVGSLFFGMEIRGELSMTGSSIKTGGEDKAGTGTSWEGSIADWFSAASALDWQPGTVISPLLIVAVSTVSDTVGSGVSPDRGNSSVQSVK